MGRPISFFSGYEQRENRTSNYVLLMLKLVYEECLALVGELLPSVDGSKFGANWKTASIRVRHL